MAGGRTVTVTLDPESTRLLKEIRDALVSTSVEYEAVTPPKRGRHMEEYMAYVVWEQERPGVHVFTSPSVGPFLGITEARAWAKKFRAEARANGRTFKRVKFQKHYTPDQAMSWVRREERDLP
jgi:hypothetical protein